jgi:hypothetical protein
VTYLLSLLLLLINMPGVVTAGRDFDATSDAIDHGEYWIILASSVLKFANSKCHQGQALGRPV